MTRSFATSTLFPYPFPQVAQAIWFKYPNPYAEHVCSIDVLDHSVCPRTGIVSVERLISLNQNIPSWAKRLIGIGDSFFAFEQIQFHPQRNYVEMHTVKFVLSHRELFQMNEDITYAPDRDETRYDQAAHIQFLGLGHRPNALVSSAVTKIEDAALTRFRENAKRGRWGFMHVLKALYDCPDASPLPSKNKIENGP